MAMATTSHRPSSTTCSLLAPCKRALTRLFRIPASIRAFRLRNFRRSAAKMSRGRGRRHPSRSFQLFRPLIRSSSTPATSTESPTARRAAPEVPMHAAPVPSPETPAYVKMVERLRSRTSACIGEEKELEACHSFESCLMEILTEEGKVRDRQDVEELLRCWERLKSPVFVDLVCRFYGDLCKDLFSSASAGGDDGAGNADRDEGSVSTSAALLG